MRLLRLLVVLALLCPSLALAGEAELRSFGQRMGLRDLDGFVAAVTTIRATGRLPDRWITKNEARELGWRPGDNLCDVAADKAIGGDRFGNREGRLPEGPRWREADLDFRCGRRGAKRLIFSNHRDVYVTVDHYETFVEVPR